MFIAKLFFFLLLSILINYLTLKLFQSQKIFQSIYKLSPYTHQAKTSTPTFGGIGIFLSSISGLIIFQVFSIKSLWLFFIFTTFACLGFIDDFLSQLKKQNQGLSAIQKFLIQIILASLLLLYFHLFIKNLNPFLFIFYIFLIVGSSNATNLTDGLDGLLGGLSIITLLGYSFFFQSFPQICQINIIFIISVIGFLIFNFNPAKIFMGDTGSLGIGALFAGLAIIANNVWILIPLGIVYIIETLSVIIQVIFYKISQKRIFKMAPIHHHFELSGISEKNVVKLFWLIGILGLLFFMWQNNLSIFLWR